MIERAYIRVTEWLLIAGLCLMVAATFVSTVMRGIPGLGGLYWAEEITRYMCIWVVFLASGLTIRYGVHFRVDLLIHALPIRPQQILSLFICLVMFWFEWVLIYYGGFVTLVNMDQQSASLGFPIGYVYAAIPTGGALMFYETLRAAIRAVRTGRPVEPDMTTSVLVD